jgi:outer membrane protein assembly factor BamB
VSWNGKGFEVAAVAPDGVDVNGVLVRRKELIEGDVIRVGDLDLVLLNGSDEKVKATALGSAAPAKTTKRHEEPRREEPRREVLKREEPLHEELDHDDLEPLPAEISDRDLELLTAGEIEIPVVQPEARPKKAKAEPRREEPVPPDEPTAQPPRGEPKFDDGSDPEELPVLPVEPVAKPAAEPLPKAPATRPESAGVWGRFRGRRRPGEQDALKSPLVLGLGGLSLALVLVAAAIWLLIGREGANRLYEAATADREARRYAEAIERYEQFLKEYPSDSRADDARYEPGRTRVERYTAGASPDWDKAIQEFDRFAKASRDEPEFDQHRDLFLDLAGAIASGAAADAVRSGGREPLAAAAEGGKLYDRYAPADGSANSVRDRLAKEYAAAETAVRKQEYFDEAAKKIEAALAKSDLAAAFETRANLLNRYPDLASNKRVQTLLTRTLETERKLVRPVTAEDARPEAAPPAGSAVLTLVGHTQARAGEVSDGRLVFALARDAVVGLDAVTGRPRWRRAVGLGTPFFPVEVEASVPALLAFDASRNELLLIRRNDGEPLWRAAVGAAAVGPPLVTQGQIDLATADGRLLRFALETGAPLAGVAFPQGVVGPPVLADGGERLVLFGDRATAYTLDLRSLEVGAVSFTGQAAGAIDAPPAPFGKLVIACENDRLDSAVVRAFAVDAESGSLRQVAAERINGRTRQPLVARGNVLFVPSSPERITAFSISDDAGQPPLTQLAGVQIPDAQDVPTFLVTGPEGMLWEAGSALRKMRLGPKGLELLPGIVAPGRHTQPPQESGESLFVARSLASSPAVYVSQADREAMTGTWRTVLGGSILAAAIAGQAGTLVTDAGQAAVLSKTEQAGFVDAKPLPRWDEASPDPLQATTLFDGRAAVWRGGAAPLLWLVRPGEEPGQPRSVAAAPECAPVALDGGLVLPLPGKLEWLPDGNGSAVEAFLLPIGAEGQTNPKWKSLARLDGERFAVLDDAGALRVLAVRREPLPHLAEVASASLGKASEQPIAGADGKIVAAIDRQVRLLDPAGLRPLAEAALDRPVTGGPWVADGSVVVQTAAGAVVALDGERLTEQWRVAFDSPTAGGPIRASDGWIVASQTGTVLSVGDEGAERTRVDLGESLTGLHRIGESVFAATLGGSLLPLSMDGFNPSAADSASEGPPAGSAQR